MAKCKFQIPSSTEIKWHNLLKNPNDLPPQTYPLRYLCVGAFDEEIIDSETVLGFGIFECLYNPSEKRFYTLIQENLDLEKSYESDENILQNKYLYQKPASNIIAWSYPFIDYLKSSSLWTEDDLFCADGEHK